MRIKQSFISLVILSILIIGGCSSSADWAYGFVVWKGYIYRVSDEYVDEIDKKLGHVTKYSDREGTYFGNFSNIYKKGTKYYSIKGISTDEAIAIEEDGKYRKAIRSGKYGEKLPIN